MLLMTDKFPDTTIFLTGLSVVRTTVLVTVFSAPSREHGELFNILAERVNKRDAAGTRLCYIANT